MNFDVIPRGVLVIIFGICAITAPSIALAAEVPVKDATLIAEFKKYVTTFNTQLDATKDIITGADPQGASKAKCHTTATALPAKAYQPAQAGDTTVAWYNASEKVITDSTIPETITSSDQPAGSGLVSINDSASLRCLLQELVEWEKLGLSIQIHSMLKSYIADAQAKQLTGQLMSKIAAATLQNAKVGNEIVVDGVKSTSPLYTKNASADIESAASRQLDHITAQALAQPDDPIGSLGFCAPLVLPTAASIERNNRNKVEDPFFSADSVTRCNLDGVIDPNDASKFYSSFNDPASQGGGVGTFMHMVSNPADNGIGAGMVADSLADSRIAAQKEAKKAEAANSGALPKKSCTGEAFDPFCLEQQYMEVDTPQYQTEESIKSAAAAGRNNLMQLGDTADGSMTKGAADQSIAIDTTSEGLDGYDPTPLAMSKTAVNDLIREYYDIIDIGYFGISANTTDWAQATMLMIYDEMKFDPTKPAIVVTEGSKPDPIDI